MYAIRLIILVAVFPLMSSCSLVTAIGSIPAAFVENWMIDEVDMPDEEFETPLKINITPHPINHNLVVKKDGSLWSIYDGSTKGDWFFIPKEIYLGRSSKEKVFDRVESIDNVKMTITTVNSHLALKKDGTVWSWGAGDANIGAYIYESTLGYESNWYVGTPRQVKGLPKISHIAYVEGAVLATAIDGTVWSWGFKYKNYRGPEDVRSYGKQHYLLINKAIIKKERDRALRVVSKNYWSNFSELRSDSSIHPVKIPELKNIIKAYGGSYLTAEGEVLVTMRAAGDPKYMSEKISDFIYKVKLPSKAVDISNGYALLENGHVWHVGESTFKRLKDDEHRDDAFVIFGTLMRAYYVYLPPYRLKTLSKIVRLGDSIALSEDNEIAIWGYLYSITGMYTHSVKTPNPVYIFNSAKNIEHLSRISFVTDNGDVWLRWNDGLFSKVANFPEVGRGEFFSPTIRKVKLKRAMEYQKVLELSL